MASRRFDAAPESTHRRWASMATWWRTLAEDTTITGAHASLDEFCVRVGDVRTRRREAVTTTVAAPPSAGQAAHRVRRCPHRRGPATHLPQSATAGRKIPMTSGAERRRRR